ncbi:hypothetical protein [Bacillus pumilus]|nr:hypothetical protein [Bacillus pumilus]
MSQFEKAFDYKMNNVRTFMMKNGQCSGIYKIGNVELKGNLRLRNAKTN